MKIMRLLVVLMLGLLVLVTSVGCSAQRKPDMNPQGQGIPPAPTAPAPAEPLPTIPTESTRLAKQVADEAVKVNGVNSVTVVLTGSTAMAGVDLKPGVDPNVVKDEVASVIKKSEKRIKNVLVSTDPELNQRIASISKGIAEGRPISSFAVEVREIMNRLTPTAR